MAEYQGSHKWRAEWADPVDVRTWLDRELIEGYTANVCCGQSFIGDVRVDVDPDHDPDVLADVHSLPFADHAFDTVYCDPPFALYAYQDGYWPDEVWRVTDGTLILNCPGKRVTLSHYADKEWYVIEPKPGSPVMSVGKFQVFHRQEGLGRWSA